MKRDLDSLFKAIDDPNSFFFLNEYRLSSMSINSSNIDERSLKRIYSLSLNFYLIISYFLGFLHLFSNNY